MRDLAITDLIRLNASGLDIASFTEIRSSVINRYKEVYGSDIDVSTGTADGVFINDISLMINNILQTMSLIYSNLDVNSASGVFLDALCRLSNIRRKQATNSIASILIKNASNASSLLEKGTEFVDRAGTLWVYENDDISLNPNESVSITVKCVDKGPIKAPAGWIINTVELSSFIVTQEVAAQTGSTVESDSALKARRNQSNGAVGVTVLESLSGALLAIDGIEDVLIYNNNTSSSDSTLSKDGSTILPHSIYVIIRQRSDISIEPSVIGNLIYKKLTPGISTSPCLSSSESQEYDYIPSIIGGLNLSLDQKVYWKQAKPIAPTLSFSIQTFSYFSASEISVIANALIEYANGLPLNSTLNQAEMLAVILDADPTFKGNRTYLINFNSASPISVSSTVNPSTYYHYDLKSEDDTSYYQINDNIVTITIQ